MLKSTPTCPLPDIREARIDPTLPVNERLRLFAAAIGDPHRFRGGDTDNLLDGFSYLLLRAILYASF